jgi:hypothetical protein
MKTAQAIALIVLGTFVILMVIQMVQQGHGG